MPLGDRFQALLVEDDPLVARAVERCLRARGVDVIVAATCEAARSMKGTFDTAVLDIELPDGDGIEVANHLLQHRTAPVIVFFSGHDAPEVVSRAEEIGMFVHKSLGPDALLDALTMAVLHAAGTSTGDRMISSRRLSSGIRRKVPR
jgi:DNA-binding response OmpR family regulator